MPDQRDQRFGRRTSATYPSHETPATRHLPAGTSRGSELPAHARASVATAGHRTLPAEGFRGKPVPPAWEWIRGLRLALARVAKAATGVPHRGGEAPGHARGGRKSPAVRRPFTAATTQTTRSSVITRTGERPESGASRRASPSSAEVGSNLRHRWPSRLRAPAVSAQFSPLRS